MVYFKINGPSVNLSYSEKVKFPLIVCSHERSGTHFMMNSISECTEYTSNPFLNFDYIPLGSFVNFFSQASTYKFLNSLKNVRIHDNSTCCTNSIIKSHFPLSLLSQDSINECKIIYVYRNPLEVFESYWKFLHRWNWFEGPKLQTPLELMKSNPKGQSQRYQIENFKSYFARWASHVIDAKELSKNSNNILLINYDELKNNFKKTIKKISNKLEIDIINSPRKPDKEKYIHGKKIELDQKEKKLMKDFIHDEIKQFTSLPEDLQRLFEN